MNSMIFITDLFRRALLLHSLGLGRGPVLISAADVDGVVSTEAAVPREDISAEHTSDDVAEVRDVVDVGESAGDEDVPAAGDRELGGFGRRRVVHLIGKIGRGGRGRAKP